MDNTKWTKINNLNFVNKKSPNHFIFLRGICVFNKEILILKTEICLNDYSKKELLNYISFLGFKSLAELKKTMEKIMICYYVRVS